MYELLLVKFDQCPEFRTALAQHGTFVEDTNHPYYARGKYYFGLNILGRCLTRLRDTKYPHLVVLGDSHLRDLPHDVQATVSLPPPARSSAFTEFGRVEHGDSYVLTSIVCVPGASTKELQSLVRHIPFLVKDASHVAVLVGTNDLSSPRHPLSPPIVQNLTKLLHSKILAINPWSHLLDVSIPPRFDSFNTLVVELNLLKSQDKQLCVPTKLSRNNSPIASYYAPNDQIHLNAKGKLKLMRSILQKLN